MLRLRSALCLMVLVALALAASLCPAPEVGNPFVGEAEAQTTYPAVRGTYVNACTLLSATAGPIYFHSSQNGTTSVAADAQGEIRNWAIIYTGTNNVNFRWYGSPATNANGYVVGNLSPQVRTYEFLGVNWAGFYLVNSPTGTPPASGIVYIYAWE